MQDLVELIHVVASLEDRLPSEQLRQDASNTPHIDSRAVVCKAQHDLGGAVPSGRDVLGHEALVRGAFLLRRTAGGRVSPRKSEVADLELAVGVDKEVSGLEIAVKDVGGVDVLQAAEGLVDEGLEVGV